MKIRNKSGPRFNSCGTPNVGNSANIIKFDKLWVTKHIGYKKQQKIVICVIKRLLKPLIYGNNFML